MPGDFGLLSYQDMTICEASIAASTPEQRKTQRLNLTMMS